MAERDSEEMTDADWRAISEWMDEVDAERAREVSVENQAPLADLTVAPTLDEANRYAQDNGLAAANTVYASRGSHLQGLDLRRYRLHAVAPERWDSKVADRLPAGMRVRMRLGLDDE